MPVYLLRPLQGRAGPFRNNLTVNLEVLGSLQCPGHTISKQKHQESHPGLLSLGAQGAAGKPSGERLLCQLRKPVSLLPRYRSGAVTLLSHSSRVS